MRTATRTDWIIDSIPDRHDGFDRPRERMLRCAASRFAGRHHHRPITAEETVARATVDVWNSRAGALIGIVVSMRPRQWIKNLVVFAALIFAKKLNAPVLLARSSAAFLLFCATSGAVYIVNDLFDADRDRKHPIKRRRPIASKRLGAVPALTSVMLLLTGSMMFGFALSPPFGAILLIYVVVNVVYSLWLKEVVIIDVMVIAAGFVLRAVGGGLVIDVPISHWLIMCTILLSLFLAFCKRRQELEGLESPHEHRAILREYS